MTATTKKYVGESGSGGFDGYAGLTLGTTYTGTPQDDGTVRIELPTGRATSVTAAQWEKWFK